MSDSFRWSRPRLLLALLLAALVAGAVPLRVPSTQGDKGRGTAAWRAVSARPLPPRPDVDAGGGVPLASEAAALLPAVTLLPIREPHPPRAASPAPPAARSPLPRAPPLA